MSTLPFDDICVVILGSVLTSLRVIVWEIAKMDDPPLRVVIGSDAYQKINEKIKTYGELYPKYEKLSSKSSFEKLQ